MARLAPAALTGLLALIAGRSFYGLYRRRRALATARTTGTDELAPGRVELAGRIEPDGRTATDPMYGEDVVVADWEFGRVARRRASREAIPSPGQRRRTLARGRRWTTFRLVDDDGEVLVDPADATIETSGDGARIEAFDDPRDFGAFRSEIDRDRDRAGNGGRDGDGDGIAVRVEGNLPEDAPPARTTAGYECELALLRPGDEVTVVGDARRADDGFVVDGGEEFVVSDGSRATLRREATRNAVLAGAVAAVLFAATVYFLVAG